MATFKGSEYFCYDLSLNPIQGSSEEITLSFKTLQRNGLLLHTGKSADYVNLALINGAVSLVINLGSGTFEALVELVNGKFNDNEWHDVKVTRNLRQVIELQELRRIQTDQWFSQDLITQSDITIEIIPIRVNWHVVANLLIVSRMSKGDHWIKVSLHIIYFVWFYVATNMLCKTNVNHGMSHSTKRSF